jgi:sulfate adenylyltransferase
MATQSPADSQPRSKGVCIFLTGLSGSGKSTIASALSGAIETTLARPVTLLDGDVVRTHLSRELGFSRADRDTNIERIAFVAAEVVKHGGVVISAAIAPYDAARLKARERVAEHGRFVLVYLSTPLSVCEDRDAKGLYAKARRGEIAMFTGVSDTYEVPTISEVTIYTSAVSVENAVKLLLLEIAKDEA